MSTELFVSPSVENYTMPLGELYFTAEGSTEEVHMGNSPKAEVNLTVKTAEHYSSMQGMRRKDLTVVTEANLTFKATLDEWMPDNIAMALLATQDEDSDGNTQLAIGEAELVYGQIRFHATNDVGRQVDYILPSVAIKPSKALAMVAEGFESIEIEGDVQATKVGSKYRFGTATFTTPTTE